MRKRFFLTALFLLATLATQAAVTVSQYFPLNSGDTRSYEDYYTPSNHTTELTAQTNFNGHAVFAVNLRDQQGIVNSNGTGTWYFATNGGNLALYGIDTSWGTLTLTTPANLITPQSLANNGSLSTKVKGTYQVSGASNLNYSVSIQTSMEALGTVATLGGTFTNCKQLLVLETSTLNGTKTTNYDSAAWVLAPDVGITIDGFAQWNNSVGQFSLYDTNNLRFDFLELEGATINNVVIDYMGPSNTLASFPTNNTQLYTNPVHISGVASDAGVGDHGVSQVTVNGNTATSDTAAGDGSANWAIDVDLPAGTNAVTIIATDDLGNKTTSFLTLAEMLPAPVLITQPLSQPITPGGDVSFSVTASNSIIPLSYQWRKDGVALAGATDSSYTINGVTASEAGKYSVVVSNASGSVTSSNATLLIDSVAPTLTILTPKASQRVSNDTFTVTGKAADKVGLENVFWQLNGGSWTAASLANGGSNWTAGVTLSPGTNLFKAYATDVSGNLSATSSVSFVYVVSAVLTVSTNGHGSISPNYNGDLLEVGKSYTMKATAVTGFKFTGWTGSEATANPSLTFLMEPNLTFTANFDDGTMPTLSILTPKAHQSVSNAAFTVTGKTGDNVSVANVFYELNDGAWTTATPVNGWSNWTAAVTLTPGTNIFKAYAADTTGNLSATSSVSFVYVVSAVLTVNTNGQGTISPSYNGDLLQVGKSYTMKATAATGYKFTGWTGSEATANPSLTFLMASNLTFTANFADSAIPTLSILTPKANQSVSNSAFTVTGKAADNLGLANVFYSLNGGSWTAATPANGWSNWTAGVMLTPGTNIFKAYAADTTGNLSATSSVSFVYVVSAVLTVNTNGRGTISPNYNGDLLQVGKSYTMKATAAKGFKFTGWTGSEATANPSLTFLMASNLTFTANFADSAIPTLSILTPKANQSVSNSAFTVTGKAADNLGLANVFYSLNGGSWTAATPANGWSNWTAAVTLTPGTNVFKAYAADTTGNLSATSSVSFVYVVSAVLTVNTNGQGTVSPNYNGDLLQVGKSYTMKATAAKGFKFTGWTGSEATANPSLTFLMASNLTFTANFADSVDPVVLIKSPTNSPHYTNVINSVDLAGTATDNQGVTSVTWSNDQGGSGDATGSNSWSVTGIPLQPGTNLITITAHDAAGNTGSATLSVKLVSLDGIYMGQFAGDSTGFAMLITPDYNGIVLGYDESLSEGLFFDGFGVSSNGAFNFTTDQQGTVTGNLTPAGVSGTAANATGKHVNFTGTLKSATGIHQDATGYYHGSVDGETTGTLDVILAADGSAFFFVNTGAGSAGARCTINSANAISGSTVPNGSTIKGTLDNTTFTMSGTYGKGNTVYGTYSATRVDLNNSPASEGGTSGWVSVGAGLEAVSAAASGSGRPFPPAPPGFSVTSDPNSPPPPGSRVSPRTVAPLISAITSQVAGNLQFTISNLPLGKTLVIEGSANLQDWSPVQTTVITAASLSITVPMDRSTQLGFFRAVVK